MKQWITSAAVLAMACGDFPADSDFEAGEVELCTDSYATICDDDGCTDLASSDCPGGPLGDALDKLIDKNHGGATPPPFPNSMADNKRHTYSYVGSVGPEWVAQRDFMQQPVGSGSYQFKARTGVNLVKLTYSTGWEYRFDSINNHARGWTPTPKSSFHDEAVLGYAHNSPTTDVLLHRGSLPAPGVPSEWCFMDEPELQQTGGVLLGCTVVYRVRAIDLDLSLINTPYFFGAKVTLDPAGINHAHANNNPLGHSKEFIWRHVWCHELGHTFGFGAAEHAASSSCMRNNFLTGTWSVFNDAQINQLYHRLEGGAGSSYSAPAICNNEC